MITKEKPIKKTENSGNNSSGSVTSAAPAPIPAPPLPIPSNTQNVLPGSFLFYFVCFCW